MELENVIINGVEYAPSSSSVNRGFKKIGVGITTRNRNKVLAENLKKWKELSPDFVKFVIVDDFSEKPVENASFRFSKNVGIAAAKNKCLELLMEDSEISHIFLADDDTFPIAENWWESYIFGEEPHAMNIFRLNGFPLLLNENENYFYYENPRGCLLYFKREVIEKVGGMDTIFGKWGNEHVELSWRIFFNGFTSSPFPSPKNDAFYCMDSKNEIPRTTTLAERNISLAVNDKILAERISLGFKKYVPFKENSENKVVFSCLFGSINDPQRSGVKVSLENLKVLSESLKKNAKNWKKILFTDFTQFQSEIESLGWNPVFRNPVGNIFFQRWEEIYSFLIKNPEVQEIWAVDSTDVKLLQPLDDFVLEDDKIYVGFEPKTLKDEWLINHHNFYRTFFEANHSLQLLNAGVFGGKREIVLEFLRKFIIETRNLSVAKEMPKTLGDMGTFNFVLHNYFSQNVVWGSSITTLFKKNEETSFSLWKHK